MAALDYTFIFLAVICLLVLGIALGLGLAIMMRRGYAYAVAPQALTNETEIVSALPLAMAYFDQNDQLQQVNEKLLQLMPMIHGVKDQRFSRLEFFRALAEAGIFVDAAHRVPAFLEDVAKRAQQPNVEWEVSLTDGRSLRFNERTTDGGGRLLSCVDITRLKQQSWALDEKSELLRSTLESIDQGVVVFDSAGDLLTWNQRYFDLFGVTSEIAEAGLSIEKLCQFLGDAGVFDDTSAVAIKNRAEAMLSCTPPRHEMTGRDGQALDVRRNRMPDAGITIAITDITEQKQGQEDLRKRSEELEAIFGNLDVGIAFIGPAGEIVALNEGLYELQGLDPDRVAECRTVRDLLRLSADNGELGEGDREELVEAVLEKSFGAVPSTYQRTRQNGDVLEFRTFAMPGGGVLAVCQNVTEQQNSEQALRVAKEQAELANRAKSEFLANTSHELRTPLNAIIGFSEILVGELFGPLSSPKYLEYSKDINESGQHLLSIINDLLDLAKVEAGHFELSEEQFLLSEVVVATARLTQERASEGGVRVITEIDPDIDLIRADKRALKQVILNLLSNAIKFILEGGQVTVGTGRRRDLRSGEEQIELWVTDTGIGMKEEDIPFAMTPFAQVDGSSTRRFEGTGLGLPLALHLCELHGGTLAINSEFGEGTTVTMLLPAERMLGNTEDARQELTPHQPVQNVAAGAAGVAGADVDEFLSQGLGEAQSELLELIASKVG